ncbi:SDR family NAD(P)-dependent oxidoreductase, partial [Bacillus inaquosorum]|uniref:SDR family NAD(P)-dependent oxidoreductase n=1 Tax=Bacillus inaquosorum TaxID=483913 RepID=UPI00227FA405
MVELERLFSKLLWRQLQSMGMFTNKHFHIKDVAKQYGLRESYKRWLEASIRFLAEKEYLAWDGQTGVVMDPAPRPMDIVWKEWDEQKQPWLAEANTRAQVVLVEAMMRSLPDILTGKKLATDTMFPQSSFELVEGIYKNNVVVDYFNDVLAAILVNYCNLLRQQHPSAKINILEIGAGTGGTSAGIFEKLAPNSEAIGEYCYTDISKAFLLSAEKAFYTDYPYTTYRTLNIEAPIEQQGFQPGIYDVVVAANVLHATRDIKRTLANTKSLLRKNGLLLINEISQLSLFTHLTFGLTDGWWLYDDAALRIPGCPGLYPETWQKVLEEGGFRSVLFPAEASHNLGQQIIAAESDGVIRLKKSSIEPLQRKEKEKQGKETVKPSSSPSLSVTGVEEYIADMILEQVADSLKMSQGKVDKNLSFAEYGVDSIIGVRLIQALNDALGIELQTTDLFDYTSVKLLTDYITSNYKEEIASKITVEQPQEEDHEYTQPVVNYPATPKIKTNGYANRSANQTSKSNQSSNGNGPIAIIGMSGRFPQAPTVDALWQQLIKGENLVSKVTRWDLSQYYGEGAAFCDYGAYLEDIDQFDPLFFNISGMEATYMDPQQRLFLLEAWKAMENAGYVGDSVKGRNCGVYVGCGGGDYTSLFVDSPPPQALWGALNSAIPARIAYLLNLKGPAVAVDTACSSSLVALHMSCQSLWSGETEMALAGGVYINNTPQYHLLADKAGMLSQQGRCFTFDDRADGMVPGEAVGAVVLKRLDDAIRDGDHIYGVIQGSGINQDGTTNGITAPSLRSQQHLEESVYETFDINPEEIQMVEAHGTGTKLGDPIEFHALNRSFRSYTDQKGYCALGSIKTNIGHTQLAAGISGLIKILLSLSHKQIPPSLHFEKENANIQLKDSPFFVNTELKEWEVKPGIKRRAALSSFGATGTNAHMVIEEAPELIREHPEKPAYLFVLSARTEERLHKQVEQFITYCEHVGSVDCGNISYTLLFGRQHFKYRLACVAPDLVTARQALLSWVQKGYADSVYVGKNQEQREKPTFKQLGNQSIRQCQVSDTEYLDNLSTVADLFVQGYELDYPALFANGQYSRVPLPTYPFALERYWVPQPDADLAPAREATAKAAPTQPQAAEEVTASTEESQLMTFAESWQRQDLTDERMPLPAVWVCFLSNPTHQQALRTVLQTRYPGTEVIFVAQGTAERRESPHHYQLIREDGVAYRQTLQRIAADWGPGFALLYLWPLEDPAVISDYMPLFHLFQAVREAKPARFLWAGEWTTPLERSYLESWIGWERSLGLILPQMGVAGVLQKAAPEMDMAKWLNRLADELASPAIESVLYEGEQRHVCRMEPTDTTEGEGRGLIKEGGTYLITGGGGGLGRRLAANLTRSRSVNLVLTGRSPLSAALAAEIKQWEGTGSHVIYCQADVCDRAAMADVQQKAKTRFGGIDGVIHAAGLASKEPFFAKSAADFACVLAPKVQGAQVLDEVLAPESLDFVCYFSSSSAILGDMGAGDYAMANRFLMAYAYQRQTVYPGKTLVIQWPLWKEGGMGLGDDEQTHMYLASSGQQALETEEGLALFERLLGQASTQHLVLKGQPDRVHRFLGLGQTAAGESSPERLVARNLPAGQGRREEMKGLSVRQCVEWDLKEIASSLLQIPRNQLHLESNLADFGFDSITLATFAERLTAHYQVEITPALFFGYPTLGKLADYYQTEHAEGMAAFYREGTTMEKPSSPMSADRQREQKAKPQPAMPEKRTEQPPQPKPQVPEAQQELEPIAVIGMSGRFPGARTIDQMWEHLVKGEEQVQPAARWAEEGEQWRFGVVPGASEFDPAFFEISPREAQSMDPRQRLLLQEAWRALEDAGYGAKQIKRHRIGMFVGVENGDYQYLSGFQGPITANHDAILAARLSYVLNLNGPNMAINTACSS